MKRLLFLIIILLLGACIKNLHAQINATVVFNYDVNGNRTSLNYIITRVEENTESADEEDLSTNGDTFGDITISVYPNPTSGILVLSSNSQNQTQDIDVKLMSLQGNIVDERWIADGNTEFNLTNYPPGIYFLSISHDGERQIWKIIKK